MGEDKKKSLFRKLLPYIITGVILLIFAGVLFYFTREWLTWLLPIFSLPFVKGGKETNKIINSLMKLKKESQSDKENIDNLDYDNFNDDGTIK